MNVNLKNNTTGAVEETPLGYSWTTFFLGCIVPLARGDWSNFFKYCMLCTVTLGIYHFIFCAKYNKEYIKGLVMQGYRPMDDAAEMQLKMNGIFLP